ncbi:hypothetical protein [Leeuwenhoekiella nanhaiensis]|uniref:hypothetical protein n=1 Tax=Leeuwenhoekiella nanhaiensis TaxID=1655491 RepID=UPI001670B3EF|nr:hypothetical protein [Leeuwenhoekiella nanhaiensis]
MKSVLIPPKGYGFAMGFIINQLGRLSAYYVNEQSGKFLSHSDSLYFLSIME